MVSYSVKVKLYLGALSGELVAELPFILMHPKVPYTPVSVSTPLPCAAVPDRCVCVQEGRGKVIHADSQADVEMFRQDTVHHQESVEVY